MLAFELYILSGRLRVVGSVEFHKQLVRNKDHSTQTKRKGKSSSTLGCEQDENKKETVIYVQNNES